MNSIWMGVIRHLLTAFGGGLVASGDLDPSQLEVAVGGVMAIVGVVLSILAKRKPVNPAPLPYEIEGQNDLKG